MSVHGKPDAGKLARPVWGEGWGNLPPKGGKAPHPYSTRPVVAQLAREFGFDEAARWVEDHRGQYAEAIFRGFETTEDD